MSGDLASLEESVRHFHRNANLDRVDPGRLASLVDELQGVLCTVLHRARTRGDHLLAGRTPTGWAAATCSLSPTSASDRLCVGAQLEAMPRIAAALASGQIGYQSASVI